RGEFPKVRHETRVRIGGKASFFKLAAEIFQALLRKTSFQKGAGINPGRGVPLKINLVAFAAIVLPLNEMMESHLVEGRRRGECGDVAADPLLLPIGPD